MVVRRLSKMDNIENQSCEQLLNTWLKKETKKFPFPSLVIAQPTCQFIPLLAYQSHCFSRNRRCKNFIAQFITINTESSVRFCMKLCFAISWFSHQRI